MTERWLVHRYAALSKTTPKRAEDAVVRAAQAAVREAMVVSAEHLDGHIEYWVNSHRPKLGYDNRKIQKRR